MALKKMIPVLLSVEVASVVHTLPLIAMTARNAFEL